MMILKIGKQKHDTFFFQHHSETELKKDNSQANEPKFIATELKRADLEEMHHTYCRSSYTAKMITFTWEINNFTAISKIFSRLTSTSFPLETNEYKIEMVTPYTESTEVNPAEDKVKFYLHATQPVRGSYVIRILNEHEERHLSKMIGHFTNTILLAEVTENDLNQFCISHSSHMLTINFVLEILEDHLDNVSHITISQNMVQKYLADDQSHNDNVESLKFLVMDKYFKVPIYLLRAIKSCYFNTLCDKYETDSDTNENGILINDNPDLFKQILLFIMHDITPKPNDYESIKNLIILSDKYDVAKLKHICERYLLRHIDFSTVLNLLRIAIASNATYLATHTIAFIKLHIKRYADAPELQNLSGEIGNKMIQLMKQFDIKIAQTRPSFCFMSHLYTVDLMNLIIDSNHNQLQINSA